MPEILQNKHEPTHHGKAFTILLVIVDCILLFALSLLLIYTEELLVAHIEIVLPQANTQIAMYIYDSLYMTLVLIVLFLVNRKKLQSYIKAPPMRRSMLLMIIVFIVAYEIVADAMIISMLGRDPVSRALFYLEEVYGYSVWFFRVYWIDAEFLISLLCIGIIAPIFEEVFFRLILFKRLRASFSFPTTAIGGSLIFAAFHVSAYRIPDLFVIGMLLSFAMEKTQSIRIPIIMHITGNMTSLIVDHMIFRHIMYSWQAIAIAAIVMLYSAIMIIKMMKVKNT